MQNDKGRRAFWGEWKMRYNKNYRGATDESRYRAWNGTLNTQIAWNQRPGISYFRGMNEFR